jgi:hypothetical protein
MEDFNYEKTNNVCYGVSNSNLGHGLEVRR